MISENCKTCSFSIMHDFVEKHGEQGFTKSDMKKQLGEKFCESEWRKWVATMHRAISPTYVYSKTTKEWYAQ